MSERKSKLRYASTICLGLIGFSFLAWLFLESPSLSPAPLSATDSESGPEMLQKRGIASAVNVDQRIVDGLVVSRPTYPGSLDINGNVASKPRYKYCANVYVTSCFDTPVGAFSADWNVRLQQSIDRQNGIYTTTVKVPPNCQSVPNAVNKFDCSATGCEYYPKINYTTCWQMSNQVTGADAGKACPKNSQISADQKYCICDSGYYKDGGGTSCQPKVTVENTCPTPNPVLPGSGVKIHSEVDFSDLSQDPLDFVRYYQSKSEIIPSSSRMNPANSKAADGGWHHNYAVSLKIRPTEDSNAAFIKMPDGNLRRFIAINGTNSWYPIEPLDKLTTILSSAGVLAGWQFYDGTEDATYNFDQNSLLKEIVARNGWKKILTYGTSNELIKVTNQFGDYLKFSYNSNLQLIKVETNSRAANYGRRSETTLPVIVQLTYENSKLKRSTTGLTSWVNEYHYEDTLANPTRLTGISNVFQASQPLEKLVRRTKIGYYSDGRVKESNNLTSGDTTSFKYTSDGVGTTEVTTKRGSNDPTVSQFIFSRDTGQVDPNGFNIFETGNRSGKVSPLSVNGACSICGSGSMSSILDSNGLPLRIQNASGTVNFVSYDSQERPILIAEYPSSYQSAGTQPELKYATSIKTIVYHPTLNLVARISRPYRIELFNYNQIGQRASFESIPTSDSTGIEGISTSRINAGRLLLGYEAELQTFDIKKLIATKKIIEEGNTVDSLSYTYNASGDYISVTDVINAKTNNINFLDSYGRVQMGMIDGFSNTFFYDKFGNLKARTAASKLENSIISYSYDEYNRVTSVISEVKSKGTTVRNQLYYSYSGDQLTSILFNNKPIPITSNTESTALLRQADTGLYANIFDKLVPRVNANPALGLGFPRMISPPPPGSIPNSSSPNIPDDFGRPMQASKQEERMLKNEAALMMNAFLNKCLDNCAFYPKPTVTERTYIKIITSEHIEDTYKPGISFKSYFYKKMDLILNAQIITDLAVKLGRYELSPNKLEPAAPPNEVYYLRWNSPVGIINPMKVPKEVDCLAVVISRDCKPNHLATHFFKVPALLPSYLLNGLTMVGANEVVTIYPVNTTKCLPGPSPVPL